MLNEKPSADEKVAAEAMDKMKKAVEADKDLCFGHFREFQETTRANNRCARTYRAVIEVRAVIYS